MSEQEQTRAEMIADLLASGETPERIFERTFEALSEDEFRQLARTALWQEILKAVTAAAAKAAGEARPSGGTRSSTPEREEFIAKALSWKSDREDPGERISRRDALLKESFMVPGHGFVTWGEATEKQHELRAAALEKLGASIFESSHLHRRAISELQAAKVSTLNEIVELRHANEAAVAPKSGKKLAAVLA